MKNKLRKIGKDIKSNKNEYVNIHIDSIDRDIEFLVSQINYLYDEQQKSKVKSELKEEQLKVSISNISHDLRTPLTSILGYIQLIREDDLPIEERKKYIQIIERRTKNLEELIENFYDLSRLQVSDYTLSLEMINLKTMLSENMVLFYNEFIKLGIEPQIYMDDNIPDVILDRSSVMRIFSNLINNMLKHGSGDIKICLKNQGNHILSEFINYAPNLDEKDIDKVFERFFIGDKARSSGSTGIGLSVTKSLVERLGSSISAQLINKNLIIKIYWKLDK